MLDGVNLATQAVTLEMKQIISYDHAAWMLPHHFQKELP